MSSNYAQTANAALHDALRTQGKDPAKSLTPELERLYVLLVLITGQNTSLGDVHDAWAVARAQEGPGHPDAVPFWQLSNEVRPFRDAIRQAAKAIGR